MGFGLRKMLLISLISTLDDRRISDTMARNLLSRRLRARTLHKNGWLSSSSITSSSCPRTLPLEQKKQWQQGSATASFPVCRDASRFHTHTDWDTGAAWPKGATYMDTEVDASYKDFLGGKPYMMPVSPWFFTNMPGYKKNWLWSSNSLWYDRWNHVWFEVPEYVQIISWNGKSKM